jgi:hypothetical protein
MLRFKHLKVSLFWKIFIWFLIAFFIITVSTVILVLKGGATPQYYEVPHYLHKELKNVANKISMHNRFMRRVNRRDISQYFLLDEDGGQRGSRKPANAVSLLHQHFKSTNTPQMVFYKRYTAVGPEVVNINATSNNIIICSIDNTWKIC